MPWLPITLSLIAVAASLLAVYAARRAHNALTPDDEEPAPSALGREIRLLADEYRATLGLSLPAAIQMAVLEVRRMIAEGPRSPFAQDFVAMGEIAEAVEWWPWGTFDHDHSIPPIEWTFEPLLVPVGPTTLEVRDDKVIARWY